MPGINKTIASVQYKNNRKKHHLMKIIHSVPI